MENLDFAYKVEILPELDVELTNLEEDIFLDSLHLKNDIFITDIENDTGELISHEITEGLHPNNCKPESKDKSPPTTVKRLFFDGGGLCIVNEASHAQEITLPSKNFIMLPPNSEHSIIPDSSNVVYWMEGNISEIQSYFAISEEIVHKFYEPCEKRRKGSTETYSFDTNKPAKRFLSWDGVLSRIDQLADESFSKFVIDYKQVAFLKVKAPSAFKKIVYELAPYEKNVNINVPYTGVPFMYSGRCRMVCHLGRKRCEPKSTNYTNINGGLVKESKKVGCQAAVDIIKVMRFPDFDVKGLKPAARSEVLKELNEILMMEKERVRFYMEYYVKEPTLSDHNGHDKLPFDKEPPHRWFQGKVNDLVMQGMDPSLISHQLLKASLKEEVGEQRPSTRRKYNPTARDVRYMREKAQKKAYNENAAAAKAECDELMSQIGLLTDGSHWYELRERLQTMVNSIPLPQTDDVMPQDGDNIVLENVAQDDQTNHIFISDAVDSSVYTTCPDVMNPINFVNCNDTPVMVSGPTTNLFYPNLCNGVENADDYLS